MKGGGGGWGGGGVGWGGVGWGGAAGWPAGWPAGAVGGAADAAIAVGGAADAVGTVGGEGDTAPGGAVGGHAGSRRDGVGELAGALQAPVDVAPRPGDLTTHRPRSAAGAVLLHHAHWCARPLATLNHSSIHPYSSSSCTPFLKVTFGKSVPKASQGAVGVPLAVPAPQPVASAASASAKKGATPTAAAAPAAKRGLNPIAPKRKAADASVLSLFAGAAAASKASAVAAPVAGGAALSVAGDAGEAAVVVLAEAVGVAVASSIVGGITSSGSKKRAAA